MTKRDWYIAYALLFGSYAVPLTIYGLLRFEVPLGFMIVIQLILILLVMKYTLGRWVKILFIFLMLLPLIAEYIYWLTIRGGV